MSKSYHDNPIDGGEHVREQLSDYMDSLLSGDDREAVRIHLEECADCRADYVELRATQKLMQQMPTLAAPRAFTLTPEMAGQVRKPSFWERFFAPRNAPRLATGSVVAFLLLIVVLAGTSNSPLLTAVQTASVPASAGHTDGTEAFSNAAPAATSTTAAASAGGQAAIPGSAGSSPTDQSQPQPPPVAQAIPTQAPPNNFSSAQAAPTPTGAAESGDVPPNITVQNSGTGSPTTTTLTFSPAPSSDGAISNDKLYRSQSAPAENSAQVGAPTDSSRTGWVALQLGLLALGLALAAAAIIAWRRT
jgi:hypothetical protein